MEFDERLHRAFGTLTERLHQEIVAHLTGAEADLAGSARTEHDRAVAEATRDAHAAAEREFASQLNERSAQAGVQAAAEANAVHTAANERLLEAIRAIDSGHSLSEILDALVAGASGEVGRVAIFLPLGTTLKGWRLVGFDRFAMEGSAVEIPFSDGGMIAEAGETGRVIRLETGGLRDTLVPAFADLSDQCRALAVPLVMTNQVVAVLYADEGNSEPAQRASWPSTLEVLARHAARALEAITATRLTQIAEVSQV
jgi:hypothetical protein